MKKRTESIICFLLVLLILPIAYSYLANAFIYYRIGSGQFSAPIIKDKYIINDDFKEEPAMLYVALGDSLTAGAGTTKNTEFFPYLIAEKLAGSDKKVMLKNFSYPGAKTQDMINDFLESAIVAKPDVVTLLIGVNDIHNHIKADRFRKNYDYILERLTKETTAKIYVISIPFIGSNSIILPPLDHYFDYRTKKFNVIIKDLAASYGVKYIDLYTPSWDLLRKDGPLYASDSFHPSAAGYKWWADIIYDNFDK